MLVIIPLLIAIMTVTFMTTLQILGTAFGLITTGVSAYTIKKTISGGKKVFRKKR